MEEIVKAPWSPFHHDGAAAFKLSERSPLPPALSAMVVVGGRTQMVIVCRIRRINCHPVECGEESAPESMSDTEHWLNCTGDLNNPNDSETDCAADNQSDEEQNNGIEDPEYPEQQDVSTLPNNPGLLRPTRKSNSQSPMVVVTVNAIETRRNKGVKKKLDRMRQWFTSFFTRLDREFQLEIYYGWMVRSSLWILVD